MSDNERLHLAQRMNALLQRELGEGIDSKRMVAQPLYARDVLLVCQAMSNTELPELAERFSSSREGEDTRPAPTAAVPAGKRAAAAAKPVPAAAPAGAPAPDSGASDLPDSAPPSGWRASLWPPTMRPSLFGSLGRIRKRRPAPPR